MSNPPPSMIKIHELQEQHGILMAEFKILNHNDPAQNARMLTLLGEMMAITQEQMQLSTLILPEIKAMYPHNPPCPECESSDVVHDPEVDDYTVFICTKCHNSWEPE